MHPVKWTVAAPWQRSLVVAVSLFAVLPVAWAQHTMHPTPAASPPRDPADPSARVPSIVHRSSLTGYRSVVEIETGDWRAANDTVGRIGGWRAYSKEADAAREAERSAPKDAPSPHRHH